MQITDVSFVTQIQGGSQVPHLNRSVRMAGKNESSRSGPHPTGTLTLVDAKGAYSAAIYRFNNAHSEI